MRTVPVTLVLAMGCAPTLSGADEVPDIDVTWGASADEALDDVAIVAVDDVVLELIADQGGIGGCAVGLVEDGVVTYLKGHGLAVVEDGVPYDVDTMSPLGSVSKTITALAALRLAEELDVDLGTTADELLPVDAALGDATLHELLAHRSGAPAGTPAHTGNPDPHDLVQPRLAYASYAPNVATDAPPGTYSNVGYATLGAVIDEQTEGYERYVWERVGRRGAWADASFSLALVHSWRDDDIATLAQGYAPGGTPFPIWEDGQVGAFEGWEGPPGGWASTIGDLARLVAAIQRREILSAASWQEALADHGDVYGRPYGYGIRQAPLAGGTRFDHGGDIAGYSAFWASYETDDGALGVALQCNFQDSSALEAAADEISFRLSGPIVKTPFGLNEQGTGTAVLDGVVFALDLSEGTAHPLGIPPAVLVPDLVVAVDAPRGGGLDLTLASASGAMTPVTWAGARFADPGFAASVPRDVELPTRDRARVRLEGALLSGNVAARGLGLDAVTLAGAVDTRTVPTAWTLGVDLCREAPGFGARCEPCADGALACVPVTIRGWTAAR